MSLYAHQFETLTRKKYGDEDIKDTKMLMKKFLATVHDCMAEFINAKRKKKMRWNSR